MCLYELHASMYIKDGLNGVFMYTCVTCYFFFNNLSHLTNHLYFYSKKCV